MKNGKRNTYLVIALAAVAALFLAINFGGGLWRSLTADHSGDIKLYVPDNQTTVFVGDRRIKLTDEKNETIEINDLDPGKQRVLVNKDGYWPWTKEITVVEGKTADLRAFLVPEKTQAASIAPGSAEHAEATRLLNAAVFPSEDKKLKSGSGNVQAWVDKDSIFAEWIAEGRRAPQFFCIDTFCSEWRKVLDSVTPITHLSFYKNREDVLVFSTASGIYAIEINQNGSPQNFQPVFLGANEKFAPASDTNYIYVLSGGAISKIAL